MPRTPGRWFVIVACRLLAFFFLLFCCAWLLLYFDSLVKRRQAEQLVADLALFSFANVGFVEARDLSLQHRGSTSPPYPCTPRNCTFEILLSPAVSRLAYAGEWSSIHMAPVLTYIGLRPWGAVTTLEIKDGLLDNSRTAFAQERLTKRQDSDELVTLMYEVNTVREGSSNQVFVDSADKYVTTRPSAIHGPLEVLQSYLLQAPTPAQRRAFNVELTCFTRISHGCRDFSELAPSAWQDYTERNHRFKKAPQTN